jgi:hypothetical protein
MKVDIYDKLVYEEDEKKKHPERFYSNGNRRVQHICVTGKKKVEEFVEKFNLPKTFINERMSLSVLWNFPRKAYDESKMWVCVSGFTYFASASFNNFIISNNCITVESQNKALEVLRYLKSVKGVKVSYSETLKEMSNKSE